jgi:hypothetical protein
LEVQTVLISLLEGQEVLFFVRRCLFHLQKRVKPTPQGHKASEWQQEEVRPRRGRGERREKRRVRRERESMDLNDLATERNIVLCLKHFQSTQLPNTPFSVGLFDHRKVEFFDYGLLA